MEPILILDQIRAFNILFHSSLYTAPLPCLMDLTDMMDIGSGFHGVSVAEHSLYDLILSSSVA